MEICLHPQDSRFFWRKTQIVQDISARNVAH